MIIIGTSGWQYRDWRGRLYPAGLPQKRWLEHYAERFATVEVNNAFYRLPERSTFKDWHDRTPDDFCVAVKLSRYLTHIKRLQGAGRTGRPVHGRARARSATGSAPFSCSCRRRCGRTRRCSTRRSPSFRAACGSPSSRATGRGGPTRCGRCWRSTGRRCAGRTGGSRPITPLWRTADWGYLRFHEGRAKPWPHYGRSALRTWADRLRDTYGARGTAYVYFNNDPGGAAVTDASAFAGIARRRGLEVTRTP